MVIDMTKDYQLQINKNPQCELCNVVTKESSYEQKITKESVDELIKVIDRLIKQSSL